MGVVRARGVWARIGSLLSKAGWDRVWAVGVVRARRGVGKAGVGWGVGGGGGDGAGGCGHALAAFKYSLNTYKMRARSV